MPMEKLKTPINKKKRENKVKEDTRLKLLENYTEKEIREMLDYVAKTTKKEVKDVI